MWKCGNVFVLTVISLLKKCVCVDNVFVLTVINLVKKYVCVDSNQFSQVHSEKRILVGHLLRRSSQ